jgi:lysophospholipase L1-like esterase
MKIKIVQLITLLLFFIGCSSNDDIIEDKNIANDDVIVNKILCIGDSRVQGFRPLFENYRYELWKNLVENEVDFDLVGPFKDFVSYPTFSNLTFDNDHAGILGDTTLDVINRLDEAFEKDIPDFVLLGIGGNDITGGKSIDDVVLNLGVILDEIEIKNNNAIVFLEIIAGVNPNSSRAASLNGLITEFEEKLNKLAEEKSNTSFKVVLVDMNTNFTNNANFYADEVHYSLLGAKEIADRYFKALNTFLK